MPGEDVLLPDTSLGKCLRAAWFGKHQGRVDKDEALVDASEELLRAVTAGATTPWAAPTAAAAACLPPHRTTPVTRQRVSRGGGAAQAQETR